MNMLERGIYIREYLPAIINKNIYLDIPVMRWSYKFEKKWYYNKHQHRTADPGGLGKIKRRPASQVRYIEQVFILM
jgi:hypothetical protein